MHDVNQIEALPELFTHSLNFDEPIGVLVAGDQPYTVTGVVEDVEDDAVRLCGRWIRLADVLGVED